MPPDREESTDTAARRRFDPPFLVILDRFLETIDGLRELHSAVASTVEELDTTRLSPEQLAAITSLTPDAQARLAQWLREQRPAGGGELTITVGEPDSAESAGRLNPPPPTLERRAETLNGTSRSEADNVAEPMGEQDAECDGASGEEARQEQDTATLNSIFGSDTNPALSEFAMRLMRTGLTPGRKSLLNMSLLTSAVGAFEVLAGALVAKDYMLHPEVLSGDAQFTLAQLRQFKTIDDATEAAIEGYVEEFARGSITTWSTWFEKRTKVKLASLAIDFNIAHEVFLRRNIVVHNAGHVTTRYLNALGKVADPPKLNEFLPVTDDYLGRALDELEALGANWATGAWVKWQSDQSRLALARLADRSYGALVEKRWLVAQHCASIGKQAASEHSAKYWTFAVNEILAMKLQGIENDEVMKAVANWETSSLDPKFRLAQAALLDDLDRVITLVPAALATGALELSDIDEWPLLSGLRADPRYTELREKWTTVV